MLLQINHLGSALAACVEWLVNPSVVRLGEQVGEVDPWCEPIELRGELDRPWGFASHVRA